MVKGRAKPELVEPQQTIQLNIPDIMRKVCLGSSTELRNALRAKRHNRPLLAMVLQAPIDQHIIRPLIDVLMPMSRQEDLDLFLHGHGGVTEVGWWIILLLRQFAKCINVLVPFQAMSGMTHIALAGDELLMSEVSVLSSVDPQREHQLLPRSEGGEKLRVSVEDLKQCMKFVKEQVGEKGKADLRGVISALFDHIEPLALGALERSYTLSRLITEKALGTRVEQLSSKDIQHIKDQIGGAYSSHIFVLGRNEVRNDLGLDVTDMNTELRDAVWALFTYYERLFNNPIPISINKKKVRVVAGGFLECEGVRRALLQLPPQERSGGKQRILRGWVELTEDGKVAIEPGGVNDDDTILSE